MFSVKGTAVPLPRLVGNLGRSTVTGRAAIGANGLQAAQQFTTGSNAGGYTFSGVRADIEVPSNPGTPRVRIHTVNSSGNPGNVVHNLTNPSLGDGIETFAAPADATLAADTNYFVVFDDTSGNVARFYDVQQTDSNAEDAGGAAGWSIADAYRQNPGTGTWGVLATGQALKIEVNGDGRDGRLGHDGAVAEHHGAAVGERRDTRADLRRGAGHGLGARHERLHGVTGTGRTVSNVAVSGSTVTLTVSPAAAPGETVTVSYTAPGNNPIQDASGNAADGLSNQAVTNNTPGVLLSTTSLTVGEGASNTYTVALAALPSGGVTVRITSDNSDVTIDDTDGMMTGDQNTLTFTTTDWSTAQTVTVRAAEDDDDNGVDDTATLTHTIDGATEYDNLSDPTLPVTVTDNDDAGHDRAVSEHHDAAVRERGCARADLRRGAGRGLRAGVGRFQGDGGGRDGDAGGHQPRRHRHQRRDAHPGFAGGAGRDGDGELHQGEQPDPGRGGERRGQPQQPGRDQQHPGRAAVDDVADRGRGRLGHVHRGAGVAAERQRHRPDHQRQHRRDDRRHRRQHGRRSERADVHDGRTGARPRR